MYLRSIDVRNVGPLRSISIDAPFNADGQPKPLALVGPNGSGKTMLLAHVIDAIVEVAKSQFTDPITRTQSQANPFLKVVGGSVQHMGASFALTLARFADASTPPKVSHYCDKSGTCDPAAEEYLALRAKYSNVTWPVEGAHKSHEGAQDTWKAFLEQGASFFMPPNRGEQPHWLNVGALENRARRLPEPRFSGRLDKPLWVERAGAENWDWMFDVLVDSLVRISPGENGGANAEDNIQQKLALGLAVAFLEKIMDVVLDRTGTRLVVQHRSWGERRLAVKDAAGAVVVPNVRYMSSGQLALLNLATTIARYADRGNAQSLHAPGDIRGIVVVDEVDAHLHVDLARRGLPVLMALFPKIQFVVATHNPVLPLGLLERFGHDGFGLFDVGSGRYISPEEYSQFDEMFETMRATRRFRAEIESAVVGSLKPLVLTEGETDPMYIAAAARALGFERLLDTVDIEWVGTKTQNRAENTGVSALDRARAFLLANPAVSNRRVAFLYDSDAAKTEGSSGSVTVIAIAQNLANTKIVRGIENLLAEPLFGRPDPAGRFYRSHTTVGPYGEEKEIEHFEKVHFAEWVCADHATPTAMSGFRPLLCQLADFAGIAPPDP